MPVTMFYVLSDAEATKVATKNDRIEQGGFGPWFAIYFFIFDCVGLQEV